MFRFGSDRGQLKCSFCGKDQDEVGKLIAGPGVYICNQCVDLCVEIIEEEKTPPGPAGPPLSQIREAGLPRHLQPALDQLTSILSRHGQDPHIPRHTLLVGPTGSGKSALLRLLAPFFPVPLAFCDLARCSESGYAGEDLSDCLLTLVEACAYDLKAAETGILVLENLDQRDQRQQPRASVYRELLRVLEGDTIMLPRRAARAPHEDLSLVTRRILFLGVGQFDGARNRQELLEWGLLKPLLARFPNLVQIPAPGVDDLLQMTPQVWEGLEPAPGTLEKVAEAAHRLGLGGWGLAHLREALLNRGLPLTPESVESVAPEL